MVRGKKILISVSLIILMIFIIFAASSFKKPGLYTTGSGETTADVPQHIPGLDVKILQYGTGDRKVQAGDYILVRYEGKLPNGTTFVTNLEQAEPFGLYIGKGEAIEGWEKGLMGMRVNEKRSLTIDPDLAYGSQGSSANGVPQDTTLTYEVHLLDIVD